MLKPTAAADRPFMAVLRAISGRNRGVCGEHGIFSTSCWSLMRQLAGAIFRMRPRPLIGKNSFANRTDLLMRGAKRREFLPIFAHVQAKRGPASRKKSPFWLFAGVGAQTALEIHS